MDALFAASDPFCYIQELLGHERVETTQGYTRVRQRELCRIRSPLDRLDLAYDGGRKEGGEQQERPRTDRSAKDGVFPSGANKKSPNEELATYTEN